MKKLLVATALLLGVIFGALLVLLNTGAGLRWTLDQALTRTGTPVEVDAVEGRLIGPVSMSGVRYRDPDTGTGIRIDEIQLDWLPGELLRGVLHVTQLRTAGIEYTPGAPDEDTNTDAPVIPDISFPLAVQIDRLELESLAVHDGTAATTVVESASLRGSLDAAALTLEDVRVVAPRYGVDNGRVRVDLSQALPIDGALQWRAKPEGMPGLAGALKVGGEIRETLKPVVALRKPFTIHGEGSLSGLFDTPAWTLDVAVPERVSLDSVRPDWPALAVQGRIQARGDMSRARLQPDVALAFQNMAATLTGDAEVSQDALVVKQARLALPDDGGVVDLSGRLGFADELPWTLDATIPDAVALDSIMPEWPAMSIQGRIRSQGDFTRASLQPDVLLAFQDMAATLTGDAEVSKDALVVKQARLARKDDGGVIDLSGRLGFADASPFTVQGTWQTLQGPEGAAWSSRKGEFDAQGDMDALTASVSGTITPPDESEESPVSLDIEAGGLRSDPSLTGSVRLPYFAFGGISASDLNANVDFRSPQDQASEIRVTVATIERDDRRVTGLELRAHGSLEQHDAWLTGRLDDWLLDAAVAGSYVNDRWQARLTKLETASEQEPYGGPWELEQPVDITWSPDGTEVARFCLRHGETNLCAGGHFAADSDWDLAVAIGELPLSWLAADAPESMRIDGTVTAEADLGDYGSGLEGEATARIARASLDWEGEEPVETTFQDVEFTAALNPAALRMRLSGKVDENGTIGGELTTGEPLEKNGPVSGSVSLDLPSLRVIQAAVPASGLEEGSARAAVSIDGTRASPRFSGEAHIEDATLDVAAVGIRLTGLRLDISGDDERRLNLDAQAASGDGTVAADGYLEWPPEGGWRGEFQVRGNQAELVRLPQALVDGTPDLNISIDETGGAVNGSIYITRARLTPDAGRPKVKISEDIVVVGADASGEPTRNPMGWHADVTIELGDDVTIKGYGLKGGLAGALQVNAPPRQPVRANGNIEIHNGKYSLYGNTFDVRRGRLVYTGGPIDNPGIDVQVGRDAGDVKVALSITGPLRDPELSLTSNRAMSDTDRMSYLLLGRPASEASEAEAGLLLRAAASLLPGGGRGVPNAIQSTLGLDTLEVQTGSPENEGASVELGKYLAPDLYVSYVAGFQQAVDKFQVRYELARHWLLQAESTTRGSGGDLLFTW